MIPLVQAVSPYIHHYGYWAIFFGVFFESLGLPLPGETMIIVAGLLAAKGVLNLNWIIVVAVLAAFVANNISYAVGYFGGRGFVIKYGKQVFLNEKKLESLENFFKLHGGKVVVIARFFLGLRQFNGFIAGMAKMPRLKFGFFNILGAILWVVWWTCLSYYFGKKFDSIFLKFYILMGILILILFFVMSLYFSKNLNKKFFLKK